MATIHVDGQSYQVNGAHNLLQACLSLGLDIPYFCWHPAMGSVGACRQCAVRQYKDKNDDKGMLVMSCMAPAADQTRIDIEDEEAKAFRASVVEWLMINHPHDCPVCEEGGHCHLQDMTVMTGHDRRRYRFGKRTRRNQFLGPFIGHEMNRCITCYRCVRFYNDYAGGSDLGTFGSKDNVYFGRYQEGTLESPFAGNLTEVCPTGVFTDQSHSDHYARKWDMQFAPGICHQCSMGCNISPGERYGDIRRIENRYHGEVNSYFLCDRGRFGYGYVNRSDRPRLPERREGPDSEPVSIGVADVLAQASDALRHARRVIGIGSPRASLESNHQLQALVGESNFSTGIEAREQACLELMIQLQRHAGLPTPTPRGIENHDAVFVLGEDPVQSAGRLGLNLRQAALSRCKALGGTIGIPEWNAEALKTLAQDRYYPLFIAWPAPTDLDDVAEARYAMDPDGIARLGFAVAHAIDPAAPAVEGLASAEDQAARRIASALMAAEQPLVVSGGSLVSEAVLEAAGSVARALSRRAKKGGLVLIRREANSTGLSLLGGQPLDWALGELARGNADAVVVLENDLYQRLPAGRVDAALSRAEIRIVLDHQRTATAERANFLLSAASFAESGGTLVNLEGRAQRFFQVYDPGYMRPETRIHESWRWLYVLGATLRGETAGDINLDTVVHACAGAHPALAGMVDAAPDSNYRIDGQKLAREPHRYSGRTSMRANQNVSEPRVPQDPDSAFAHSMEGYSGYQQPRQQVPFAWAPGWNSPQAWNKFTDEVGGHVRGGDPGACLIHPVPGQGSYSQPVQGAGDTDTLRALILPRLFGGEETSARATPIQQRTELPCITLSPEDALGLAVKHGNVVTVNEVTRLPVYEQESWPNGWAGLPAGLIAGLLPGESLTLRKVEEGQR
ncbi:NADH-quinone oxidoreductase subunit NuoG [Marinobacter orientalis]|uniref:NADH-quinone oxidoreductase n=1 Tax=Marinobacter orientalis TaxID=1928859 RepID=A0A7Y0RDI7_9GAMM|nr:NADH-quinone oxidoreductase subunit NuoG [Marinobacter orientalis]NMT64233.1 NADH-quinone oxidoreductase subunit NuoG [Marinobacter orientalis]TGX49456.1 NADH-quinone oxidoreductase subunit NuoG [Marinobacter orientalis]